MVINAHFVPFPNYARVITRLARRVDASEARRFANGTIPRRYQKFPRLQTEESRFHSTCDQNRLPFARLRAVKVAPRAFSATLWKLMIVGFARNVSIIAVKN